MLSFSLVIAWSAIRSSSPDIHPKSCETERWKPLCRYRPTDWDYRHMRMPFIFQKVAARSYTVSFSAGDKCLSNWRWRDIKKQLYRSHVNDVILSIMTFVVFEFKFVHQPWSFCGCKVELVDRQNIDQLGFDKLQSTWSTWIASRSTTRLDQPFERSTWSILKFDQLWGLKWVIISNFEKEKCRWFSEGDNAERWPLNFNRKRVTLRMLRNGHVTFQ